MIAARSSPTTSRKRPRRGPTFKRAPACYFCAAFVFITLQIPLPTALLHGLYFHELTNPFPRKPFVCTCIQNPGGVTHRQSSLWIILERPAERARAKRKRPGVQLRGVDK